MSDQQVSLAKRLTIAWSILTGADAASPQARLAALELDRREREAELGRVRAEYGNLAARAEKDHDSAAAEGFEALARRLAPLLSQLATMQSLQAEGREVRPRDVLTLFGKLERVLGEAGLTRIGAVGEEARFDTRLHQRMSGLDVADGDSVVARFVGYRLGESILLKAMVSRVEAPSGEGAVGNA